METNKTFWSPLQPTDGQENPTDEWTCRFFLRKPPKHFYEKPAKLFDYHSYQQMAQGTQRMNETHFIDKTQKHFFFKKSTKLFDR